MPKNSRDRVPETERQSAMHRDGFGPRPDDRHSDSTSRDEEIRRRAYELYVGRGELPAGDLEDWLQAEREFRERPSSRAVQ